MYLFYRKKNVALIFQNVFLNTVTLYFQLYSCVDRFNPTPKYGL